MKISYYACAAAIAVAIGVGGYAVWPRSAHKAEHAVATDTSPAPIPAEMQMVVVERPLAIPKAGEMALPPATPALLPSPAVGSIPLMEVAAPTVAVPVIPLPSTSGESIAQAASKLKMPVYPNIAVPVVEDFAVMPARHNAADHADSSVVPATLLQPEPLQPKTRLPQVPPPVFAPAIPTLPPMTVIPPASYEPLPKLPIVPPPVFDQPKPVQLPPPAIAPMAVLPVVPPPMLSPQPQPLSPSNPVVRAAEPLPTPTRIIPPAPATMGRVALLKDEKIIEGDVSVVGEKVTIRQGIVDRPFELAQVLFIGADKEGVYQYQLSKTKVSDVAARLKLARWCLACGMRSQALLEAQAILKLDPKNTTAANFARTLEESLRRYPDANATPEVSAADKPATPIVPEWEVGAEAATSFVSRVQPILANACAGCHAKADYSGTFKLTQTNGFETNPQVTLRNLKAVTIQVRKNDPGSSPLLIQSAVVHGGMTQPVFLNRQIAAFRVLEAWVHLAVGSSPPMESMPPPAVSVPVPSVPLTGMNPAPVLPTPPTAPMPDFKPIPPADTFPLAPPPPNLPPAVPQSSSSVKPEPRPLAAVPRFGQDIKPAVPTGPDPMNTGKPVDDFDPSIFNRGK